MCGICGFSGARADRALHAMVGALRHRGPDDFGVVILALQAFGEPGELVGDLAGDLGTPAGRVEGEGVGPDAFQAFA